MGAPCGCRNLPDVPGCCSDRDDDQSTVEDDLEEHGLQRELVEQRRLRVLPWPHHRKSSRSMTKVNQPIGPRSTKSFSTKSALGATRCIAAPRLSPGFEDVVRIFRFQFHLVKKDRRRNVFSVFEFSLQGNDLQPEHQNGAVIRFRENWPQESDFRHLDVKEVFSPSRITLEYNGKIRPQPDREKRFSRVSGGGGGTGSEPSLGPSQLVIGVFCGRLPRSSGVRRCQRS